MGKSSTPNLRNWLALSNTHGVGPAKFHEYLQLDPKLNNLPVNIQPNWKQVDKDLAWLEKTEDARIISVFEDIYPQQLKNISNPPPILFVLGDCNFLNKMQLAMIGTRNPSKVGLEQAHNFAAYFAAREVVITSGMAVGIDGACHLGALSVSNGKTIAVLGNGLDIIYPASHRQLASRIIANGCIVSEFSIGTRPDRYNFPRRNRIISGLSLGVLVVEAALNSGSLITADYALEQNREVFAIPGSIHSAKVKGCHQLLRQGAKLVETANDIVEELPPLLRDAIRDKNATTAAANQQKIILSVQQELILHKIDYEATCVDVIVGRSGLATGIVGSILLELELHGLIGAVPGGYARKLGNFYT
jgi:DNA processing protein